jgi:hypothetical protein
VKAVVGGALLEGTVHRTLSECFRNDPGLVGNLFKPEGSLGNIAPKIDILYLLGGVDKPTRSALKGIARGRNFFAHNIDASFDAHHEEFKDAMTRLTLHKGRTYYAHHLYGVTAPTELNQS